MQSHLIAFSLFAAAISDWTTLCAETDVAKKRMFADNGAVCYSYE